MPDRSVRAAVAAVAGTLLFVLGVPCASQAGFAPLPPPAPSLTPGEIELLRRALPSFNYDDPVRCVRDSCTLSDSAPASLSGMAPSPARVRKALDRVRRFYGLSSFEAVHSVGMLNTANDEIALHIFEPRQAGVGLSRAMGRAKSPGTVVLLHGYLGHALANSYTIRFLVEHGYTVATFDLPGHGLSRGEPFLLNDLSLHADALEAVVNAVMNRRRESRIADNARALRPVQHGSGSSGTQLLAAARRPRTAPLFAIGHSSGASVIIEHAELYGTVFDHVVLVSPLIRSTKWALSRFGLVLAGWFTDEIDLGRHRSRMDPSFTEYYQRDPFAPQRFPIESGRAFTRWVRRLRSYRNWPETATLVQGNDDETLSWRYNLRFLRRKIDGLSEHVLNGGQHCLLNGVPPIRARVHALLLGALQGSVNQSNGARPSALELPVDAHGE